MSELVAHEQQEELAPDPFFARLDEIIAILVAATGHDLRRSGEVRRRADGAVNPVAASTTAVTLSRASGYRRGVAIYNDSSASLYVKLGPSASTDDWTVKLADGDYYEAPSGYRGELSGIWDSASGQARVTEYE